MRYLLNIQVEMLNRLGYSKPKRLELESQMNLELLSTVSKGIALNKFS